MCSRQRATALARGAGYVGDAPREPTGQAFKRERRVRNLAPTRGAAHPASRLNQNAVVHRDRPLRTAAMFYVAAGAFTHLGVKSGGGSRDHLRRIGCVTRDTTGSFDSPKRHMAELALPVEGGMCARKRSRRCCFDPHRDRDRSTTHQGDRDEYRCGSGHRDDQ